MKGCRITKLLVSLGMALVLSLLASFDGHAELIVEPGQTVFLVKGDGGSLDVSSCSAPNICAAQVLKDEAKLEVITIFETGTGVPETKHAQATLQNGFTLSGDPLLQRVLPANLSGIVSWAGRVEISASNDSADASINATVRLTDLTVNQIVAEQPMVDASCSTNSLGGSCLLFPVGSAAYNLSVDLIRGHKYQFDLVTRCESFIDNAATKVACDYYNPNNVSRGPVRLSISRDFEAEIDALWAALNALQYRFDHHTHTYLTGKGVGHNNTEATTTLPTSIAPTPTVTTVPAPSVTTVPTPSVEDTTGSTSHGKSKKK